MSRFRGLLMTQDLRSTDNPAASRLFTIGYSNHTAEAFLALLRQVGVTAIADVRSAPYSRRYPSFTREILDPFLQQHEITYSFLGDTLGGRPDDPAHYHPEGWAD